jgi:regulator of protease activity HflC (stomatin/prohibitin superfamily)
MFASTALIFLILISALTLGISVKRIPEGHVYTLRRVGSTAPRMLQPGTHWVWPLIEHVTHRISLTGHALELEASDATGNALRGVVYWQVLEPERADAVIEQAESMIRETTLKALPQLMAGNDDNACNLALKRDLNAALTRHGILVTRTRMQRGA